MTAPAPRTRRSRPGRRAGGAAPRWALVHYALAAALLRLAAQGAQVAVVLLALERTGSTAVGGALVAALLVPHVLAAPAVGLLVDRSRRPDRLLGAAGLGFAAGLACAGPALGRVPTALLVVLLLATGCCGPALSGALSSRLRAVVPREALPRAFGVDALTYNLAGIGGPALAAVLAATYSPATALAALAASGACGAVATAALPGRRRAGFEPGAVPDAVPDAAPGAAPREARPGTRAAVRVLFTDRDLGPVTAATTLVSLTTGGLPVVAAAIALRAGDPAAGGWLLTSLAVGGLAGSLLWTLRPAPARWAPTVVVAGIAASGVPLALAAWPLPLPLLVAVFVLAGLPTGPYNSAQFVVRDDRTPAPLLAQVFTLGAGAKATTAALGAALAGAVAESSAAAAVLLVAGVPVLAATAGALGLLAGRGHRGR